LFRFLSTAPSLWLSAPAPSSVIGGSLHRSGDAVMDKARLSVFFFWFGDLEKEKGNRRQGYGDGLTDDNRR